jgi:hypothetical protein
MYVLKIVVCHFVLFLLPLSCLFFFDIRILITPLVSANSSYEVCHWLVPGQWFSPGITPLKTGGELRRSGRVRSFCSTSDTRRVNLVTNPVISHAWGKDREVLTTSGIFPLCTFHSYVATFQQHLHMEYKSLGDTIYQSLWFLSGLPW